DIQMSKKITQKAISIQSYRKVRTVTPCRIRLVKQMRSDRNSISQRLKKTPEPFFSTIAAGNGCELRLQRKRHLHQIRIFHAMAVKSRAKDIRNSHAQKR